MNFPGYANNPVRSFFYFYNEANTPFNHDTYAGRRRAETGAAKIHLAGTIQRGRKVDYQMTHDISSMILLRRRVG